MESVKNFAFIQKLYKRTTDEEHRTSNATRSIPWLWQELDNELDLAEREYWNNVKQSAFRLRKAADVYVVLDAIEFDIEKEKKLKGYVKFGDEFYKEGLDAKFEQLFNKVKLVEGNTNRLSKLVTLEKLCRDIGNVDAHIELKYKPDYRLAPEDLRTAHTHLRDALGKFHILLVNVYNRERKRKTELKLEPLPDDSGFLDLLIPIKDYDIVDSVLLRDNSGIRRFHVKHKDPNWQTEVYGLIYIYPSNPTSTENKEYGERLLAVREKIGIGGMRRMESNDGHFIVGHFFDSKTQKLGTIPLSREEKKTICFNTWIPGQLITRTP